MKNYIVIGNGIAATGCVEGIRSVDREGNITIISEEKYPFYSRQLIPFYLENKNEMKKTFSHAAISYERLNCHVFYERKAVRIAPSFKRVILEDGASLPYSSVCIATGTTTLPLSIEGLESVSEKFTFLTLEDAYAIKAAATKQSRVLILGAGLIGLKCAECIRSFVGSITFCEHSDQIFPKILDKDLAFAIQEHLETNRISFLLNDDVARFDTNTAYMRTGEKVVFDILVIADEIRPNTSLLEEIGGVVDDGILVNDCMETSVPGIYAAGTCLKKPLYSPHQKKSPVPSMLPEAYLQGHAAGVNMAGGTEPYEASVPLKYIDLFGFHILTGGQTGGFFRDEKSAKTVRRIYSEQEVLTGFTVLDTTKRSGIRSSLIREQTPLRMIPLDLLQKL